MAVRDDLVSNAVDFLRDPKVADAPLEKKIEFLKQKDLTEDEINLAISTAQQVSAPPAGSTKSTAPSAAPAVAPEQKIYTPLPPQLPDRDWKDYFIMATATVGITYGIYQVTKNYLLPKILPESKENLARDKQEISDEFLKLENLLADISKNNQTLQQNETDKTAKLDSVIEDIDGLIAKANERAEKYEAENKMLRIEIENLRNMFDKFTENNEVLVKNELLKLNNELKSLESLIKNKSSALAQSSPVPPVSTIPSVSDILKKKEISSNNLSPSSHSSASSNANSVSNSQNSSTSNIQIPLWQQNMAAGVSDDAKTEKSRGKEIDE